MKAITISEFGGPDVLRLVDVPDPVPPHGNVLISVSASGVSAADILMRRGQYFGSSLPGFSPGVDIAGEVVATGDGVDASWIATSVVAVVDNGGYATMVCVPVERLMRLPAGMDPIAAVALGVNAVTAAIALDHAGASRGSHILVRGAGGGLGVQAVQIAKMLGATVSVITSTASRAEKLRILGADIFTSADEASEKVFDIVFDPVAGGEAPRFLSMLGVGGKYLLCGMAAGAPTAEFFGAFLMHFSSSLGVQTFSLRSVSDAQIVTAGEAMFEACLAGTLKPIVHAQLPLSEASVAHRMLENREVFGKVVLQP